MSFTTLLIFASAHRIWLLLLMGMILWAAAYVWYFKVDLENMRLRRRPHTWSVDMANKTSKGGRKMEG